MTSALEFDDQNIMLRRTKNQRTVGTAPMRFLQYIGLTYRKRSEKIQTCGKIVAARQRFRADAQMMGEVHRSLGSALLR